MVLSEWRGFHCQHRSDDFPTIAAIVERHRPTTVVELGTDEGGFAAFLADLIKPWGGRVATFDIKPKFRPELLTTFDNLIFVRGDVLSFNLVAAAMIQRDEAVLLYCDNGNKKREIELYTELLSPGSLLGVHDYGTEVDPEWCENFMQRHGFEPEGHIEMEKLRNEWYEPMTRFWVRR